MMFNKKHNWFVAIGFVLLAHSAGAVGSLFTVTSVGTWYNMLDKPAWHPPNWLFGPVWLTLYTLMGIAAYLVWREKKSTERTYGLIFYIAQIICNALWSIIFFGLENPAVAFGEILILLTLICITTYFFWRVRKAAAVLLFPYIAWVGFASALTYAIWQLN